METMEVMVTLDVSRSIDRLPVSAADPLTSSPPFTLSLILSPRPTKVPSQRTPRKNECLAGEGAFLTVKEPFLALLIAWSRVKRSAGQSRLVSGFGLSVRKT